MSDRTWEDIAVEWMVACKAARERSVTLKSRLAEAEKTIADWEAKAVGLGCEGHPVDGHAGYPIGGSPVDEMLERFNALSARVRELEGALGPFIEPNVDLIGEPGTVGSVVTLEQFARAARALKGTT